MKNIFCFWGEIRPGRALVQANEYKSPSAMPFFLIGEYHENMHIHHKFKSIDIIFITNYPQKYSLFFHSPYFSLL